MGTAPRVEVHDDAASLATAVAGELLARMGEVQAGGRVPHVALTGGSIADAVHHEVARLSRDSDVDWGRVEVWWGDERFVPAASEERNAGQARRAFLDAVGVDPARVHEVAPSDDAAAADVHAAAAAYASEVETGAGVFDVLMLGVGPDGHCASLFPGHPALDVDDALAVGLIDSPKPPPSRVTLTYAALNRSRHVWFLASGDEKADAVASALGGADRHTTPAAGVTGVEETLWFLDRASASGL